MEFCRQVGLVLYKNFLLKKSQFFPTLGEFAVPVAIVCVIRLYGSSSFPNPARNRVDGLVVGNVYSSYVDHKCNIPMANLTIPPWVWNNISILGFTPKTALTERLMSRFNEHAASIGTSWYATMGFPNSKALLDFYQTKNRTMLASVVFQGLETATQLPLTASYHIRHSPSSLGRVQTKSIYYFDLFETREVDSLTRDDIQYLMSKAFVEEWGGNSNFSLDQVQLVPRTRFVDPNFLFMMKNFLPIVILISLLVTVLQSTKLIVYEKEQKLKETMKMMGLSSEALWTSWFLTTYVHLGIIMSIYISVLSEATAIDGKPLFRDLSMSLFWVFLMLYSAAMASFCLMMGALLKRSSNAGVISCLVAFATSFTGYLIRSFDMSRYQQVASCLLFNHALDTGMQIIGDYDTANVPLTWSKLNEPLNYVETVSMLDVWLMLLVDTGIHLLVTWYLDNVAPGDFGLPKPFFFFLTRAHWCGHADSSGARHPGTEDVDRKYFESDPVGLAAGVRIVHLRKEFGDQVAVSDLSLKMYEGQITVLLGHNGAGKTTTMSMLTGFLQPTAGTAYIHGLDIRTDMAAIRQSLGLCSQHDVLFGTLTVMENLSFFARLKGCPEARVKTEVYAVLEEVGLTFKRLSKAEMLSGGQKRKLSVAIALVNGSKVLILDEPSSGMDPQARRSLWHILQRQRSGRTMLLTTHYMDEADVLGDRIAIMAKGAVKCCGTSLFLKKRYGAGYHLVLVKVEGCNIPALNKEIRNRVPSATLENDVGREVTFLLPDNQSAQFPDLFAFLEENKGKLGITDFGASATTMEEVFLKVGESADTGDLKISSITRITVPEEASTATPAAEDESSSHSNASVHSAPREQNTDVVNDQTSDPKQTLSEVDREARDIVLTTNDVNPEASNVNQNAKAVVDVLALSRGYSHLSGLHLSLSQLRGVLVKKVICWWHSPGTSLIQLLLPVGFAMLASVIAVKFAETGFFGRDTEGGVSPPLPLNLDQFCETTVPYGVFDLLDPGSNVSQPGIKAKASARSSLGKLYAGQFGNGQHKATEVGSFKEMCKLTTGFSVLEFSRKVIVGAVFGPGRDPSEVVALAFYNPFLRFSRDIATALVLNAVAKERVNSSVSIVPVLHPLPRLGHFVPQKEKIIKSLRMIGTLMSTLMGLGWSFHTPLFVYSLVSESVAGSKHLQRVSGVSPVVFWTGNLLWDLAVCAPTFALVIVVLYLADLDPISGGSRPTLVIVLFSLFGPAMLAFNYLTHFFFKSALNALTVLFSLNLASGVILPLIVFGFNYSGSVGKAYVVDTVCMLLLPNYNLTTVLIKLFVNTVILDQCESLDYKQRCLLFEGICCKNYDKGCGMLPCIEFSENYWAFDGGVGRYLLCLFLQGLVFLLLTLEVERRGLARGDLSFPCSRMGREPPEKSAAQEDADVAEERRRIESSDVKELCKQDCVLLKDLSKTYESFRAVDRLSMGVAEKECFGLLGQNGAGKSTTFKILTGDVFMTKGQAFIKGYSVKSQLRQVQRSMGYCPQTDPLIAHMTCNETLTMFARMRGIPSSHLKECVTSFLEVFELGSHGATRAGNLSGGMKRKLCTAVSLIGDPSVIMLDEPSAGLDPGARRHLWDVLSSVRSGGATLILTSHSMEECEALCTRVAIMVHGRMKCLGTTQHLKSRFGQGFTLSVKMGLQEDGQLAPSEPLVAYVQSHFPSANCFDSDQGYAHIQIPDPHALTSAVFRAMESAKHALSVQDYSVHQSSLEQVFLAFTSDQQRRRETTIATAQPATTIATVSNNHSNSQHVTSIATASNNHSNNHSVSPRSCDDLMAGWLIMVHRSSVLILEKVCRT